MTPTREQTLAYIQGTLETLMEDWDDVDTELSPNTKLFSELGMESLDAVVLGSSIQEHYGVEMPFGQMYAELGEQQKDITLAELVDFVQTHLQSASAASSAP